MKTTIFVISDYFEHQNNVQYVIESKLTEQEIRNIIKKLYKEYRDKWGSVINKYFNDIEKNGILRQSNTFISTYWLKTKERGLI